MAGIDPSAAVCKESTKLEGTVSVGPGTAIHPSVTIRGNVRIGSNNIIEEQTVISHEGPGQLVIGDGNWLQIGCLVQGDIGSGNILECRAIVRVGGKVGNGCSIGIGCVVSTVLADDVITWGNNVRSVAPGLGMKTNSAEIQPRRELALKMLQLNPKRLLK